jgi:hypothetical protein
MSSDFGLEVIPFSYQPLVVCNHDEMLPLRRFEF